MPKSQFRSVRWHRIVSDISRPYKRLIMGVADAVALPVALWSAYALRFSDWWPEAYISQVYPLFVLVPILGIMLFSVLGLYRAVVRYMGLQAFWVVVLGVGVLSSLLMVAAYTVPSFRMPRSIPINFALVATLYVGGSRLLVRAYYQWLVRHYAQKQPVFIYGAGGAGAQLAIALQGGREFYVAAFLDDAPGLVRTLVMGIPVHDPSAAQRLVQQLQPVKILLAMPTATRQQRKQALDLLEDLPVQVLTVPSMPEIVSGEARVDDFREVEIEDLLGRDPVPPRQVLLDASIRNQVVMVTGAGGSIGSELCRQIIRLQPTQLLMVDTSEFGLYQIEQELRSLMAELGVIIPLMPLMASVCDAQRMGAIFHRHAVATVYHAAAYKHVPLVEHNVFEGIRNNTLGTLTLAELAQQHGVARFILVSTDKAVRPTNVMGASKRLAELILQDLALRAPGTVFSMVRFGNVLGSSGSVVPLFRQQIAQGGPLTVTHPDIIRYFMTIPEAALLVIQAGSMAQGGDVFVLDMGEPIKIHTLARRMIQLSGFEVRDEAHPEGDIAIEFTGLRPGEKLYEELLIGEDVSGTDHPKIMRAQEDLLDHDTLHNHLAMLKAAETRQDVILARQVLAQAVRGFTPSDEVVDWLS